MQAVGEWRLQSIIEGCFLYHKSEWAYPSIVGSGDNATILHYNENSQPASDGDIVLIDAGCEVDGYASDITRLSSKREIYRTTTSDIRYCIEITNRGD